MLTYVRDPSIQRVTINALDEQIRPKLFMQIIYLFIVSYRMLHIISILKSLITVNEFGISYVCM